MFEIPRPKSNLKITVPVGAVIIVAFIAAMVFAPMLWPQTLSARDLRREVLQAPVMTGKPAPPHVKVVEVKKGGRTTKNPFAPPRVLTTPPRVHDGPPRLIVDPPGSFAPPEVVACVGCVPGPPCPECTGTDPRVVLPPPPAKPKADPVAKPPEAPKRIAVSTGVQSAKLVNQPKPMYPPLARQAGIQGTVRLTAIIGRNGSIHSLQVMVGHPFLVKAAVDAVSQWRYEPTLLNGEPVEVVTQIDVNFTLNR